MSKQKYSVIGYYADTGRRFVNTVLAESFEAAETQTLRKDASGILVIVGTVLGEATVDSELNIRTLDDLCQFGTEEVCRDGGKHMPNFQTLAHLSGTEGELNVFCLKCSRPGSIVISVDDINW